MKDYYKILGVNLSATDKEIQQAFRHLASVYHPDKNKSAQAERIYKDVNEAYSTLHHPEKKKQYDLQKLRSNVTSSPTSAGSVYQTYRPYSNRTYPFFFYQEPTTYKKYTTEDYSFLAKWNWGAFLLGPVWAIMNNVTFPIFLYLLVFIPGYNWFFLFFIQFLFGYKGNNWAWQKSKKETKLNFIKKQLFLKYFGITLYCILLILFFIKFFIKH